MIVPKPLTVSLELFEATWTDQLEKFMCDVQS